VLLSNGPAIRPATGEYAVPEIRKLVESGKPVFGICLGHQMLSLALGAKTVKMDQGHHGANHPVKDLTTGKVEIVSMNHGFTVDRDSLPEPVVETHVSLFDGTNAGIALKDRPCSPCSTTRSLPRPHRQPLPLPTLRRPHGRRGAAARSGHGNTRARKATRRP
jgi:carbamoylphosphate synthase small subunit